MCVRVCVCKRVCECTRESAQTVGPNRRHFLNSSAESETDENGREPEMCYIDRGREGGEEIGAEVAVCLLVLPVVLLDVMKQALPSSTDR